MRTLYYLDEPVTPMLVPEPYEGWILCQWSDGREFLHWESQLRIEPFGERVLEQATRGLTRELDLVRRFVS